MSGIELNGQPRMLQAEGKALSATVAFVATYVPRHCGIATFTQDLFQAVRLASPNNGHVIVAINGPGKERFDYPGEVAFELHRDRPDDYRRAADYINFSDADVVCVQHEFGIFGGAGGLHLVELLRNLRKPVVSTLHTVLADPELHYRQGMAAVGRWSNVMVCMTRHSRDVLIKTYGIDPGKVEVIPHGAPPAPAGESKNLRRRFDLVGRHVLLTFGLLSPGKGIETAIEAVAVAARRHPDITYMIVGATHPEVKRRHGEDYRVNLQRLALERGVRQNIAFYNRYVSKDELVELLRMCDIYLIPYPNLNQAVSGTLSYAMAQGCAVVSTPFPHAREVLADGRGVLIDRSDPQSLADALLELLDSPERITQLKNRAMEYGRTITWPAVGQAYARLFERVNCQAVHVERPALPIYTTETVVEPKFDHLYRLTDDTGILQHAICRVPNRFHGYCTDDNARALQVAMVNQEELDQQGLGHLSSRYLSFLHLAQREDGRFHNFMSYQRQWQDDVGSGDCQGRAVWALGTAMLDMPDPLDRILARQLFDRAVPVLRDLHSPRSRAYAMLGLAAYLQACPDSTLIRRLLADHAACLADLYQETRRAGWLWFEDIMTYANAKLPEAMLVAAAMLDETRYRTIGADSLNFLTDQMLVNDHFSLIGNQGWLRPGLPKAPFDQQPIEAGALVSAYHTAADLLGNDHYLHLARTALDWFFGANDLRMRLYDFGTGGCCDGLMLNGVSLNQGAESTLCCLRAISLMAKTAANGGVSR